MGGTDGAVSQVCVQSGLCRVHTTEGYESASLPFSCLYTELTRPFSSHKKVLGQADVVVDDDWGIIGGKSNQFPLLRRTLSLLNCIYRQAVARPRSTILVRQISV
jgi:hypothetical protein